jgi:integrase
VRVVASYDQDEKGRLHFGPPKTAAGVRTVAIPPHLLPELRAHLATYAEAGPDGHVFEGERGKPLVRQNFRQHWLKATAAVGVDLHFHDLRGTGNTLAAATGASTRELMARLSHSSTRAAMIYQHATAQRDLGIAKALSDLVASAQATTQSES